MLISAADEKFAHHKELEKLLPEWKKIHVPVVYIQGENDDIIYTTTALFARQHLINAKSLDITMIPNQSHFLSVSQHQLINQKLLLLLETVNKK